MRDDNCTSQLAVSSEAPSTIPTVWSLSFDSVRGERHFALTDELKGSKLTLSRQSCSKTSELEKLVALRGLLEKLPALHSCTAPCSSATATMHAADDECPPAPRSSDCYPLNYQSLQAAFDAIDGLSEGSERWLENWSEGLELLHPAALLRTSEVC